MAKIVRESTLRLSLPEGEQEARLRLSNRRRTLEVRVSDAGEVNVNAPLRVTRSEIEGFLNRHTVWIAERLQAVRRQLMCWQDGERLPLLGDELTLILQPTDGRPRVWREQERLCCTAPSAALVEEAVTRWYRAQAKAWLAARLVWHCQRLARPLPPLRLSNARTRWGSLSPQGKIGLNWRLIKAGTAEIDYVICHELAHFHHRGHSAAFWREVAALCPDFEIARQRLRVNQGDYFRF